MSRINVCYIIDNLHTGGMQHQLIKLLSNIDKAIYNPCVCYLSEIKPDYLETLNRLSITSNSIEILKLVSPNILLKLLDLSSKLRMTKIHIAHTFGAHAHIVGTMAARLAGVPIVIGSRRDLGIKFTKLHYPIYRFINTFVDKIMVNSQAIMKATKCSERLSDKKIEIVYNGVDKLTNEKSFERNSILKSLGVDEDKELIGVIANLHLWKGHRYLIEAARNVLTKHKNLQFVFIGDGPLKDELVMYAKRLGVLHAIKFAGTRSDVMDILPFFEISVLPSLTEGFSNTILESMVTRVPVIATAVGGNIEIIRNMENGILVPPKDPISLAKAINLLIENKDCARAIAKKGQELVLTKFSIRSMVEKVHALYMSALSQKGIK
jgi:L-malate glycosyltransferase